MKKIVTEALFGALGLALIAACFSSVRGCILKAYKGFKDFLNEEDEEEKKQSEAESPQAREDRKQLGACPCCHLPIYEGEKVFRIRWSSQYKFPKETISFGPEDTLVVVCRVHERWGPFETNFFGEFLGTTEKMPESLDQLPTEPEKKTEAA